MKKIYFIGALLGAMMGLSSCNETWDDAPVLKTHEGVLTANFLNEPQMQSAQVMITQENKTSNFNLTCSQPDFGYAAAAAYQVQLSLTEDFAEFREIQQRFYDCAQINPLYSDVLIAIEELAGVSSEAELPLPYQKLYVRLKAFVPQDIEGTTYLSNVVHYDAVSVSYLDVWVPDVPVNIYLRGGLPGASDWGANAMYQFVQGEVQNSWVLYNVTIPAGTEFKVADDAWGDINLGGDGAVTVTAGSVVKLKAGGDNMKCGTEDFTGDITLTLADGVYTMTLSK